MADIPINPVTVTPEQKKHYEALLPVISGLTSYVHPSMPPEEVVGEGYRVSTLINEDREKLGRSGIDLQYLDSFEERSGATAWSAAQVITYINMESNAKIEWAELKPEADKVRKDLLKTYPRAFRHDANLIDAVKRIREGRGNLDWVLDFLSLHKLGVENMELLEAVYADLSLVDRAAELHTKLSDIYSRMTIDPQKFNEARVIYYKAWTYLKEALDEVYAAGQYVFDEEDPRHYLYYSDYHVRIGEAAAKARREKKAAQEDAQTNEMNEEMIDA